MLLGASLAEVAERVWTLEHVNTTNGETPLSLEVYNVLQSILYKSITTWYQMFDVLKSKYGLGSAIAYLHPADKMHKDEKMESLNLAAQLWSQSSCYFLL